MGLCIDDGVARGRKGLECVGMCAGECVQGGRGVPWDAAVSAA